LPTSDPPLIANRDQVHVVLAIPASGKSHDETQARDFGNVPVRADLQKTFNFHKFFKGETL
jgi:hypothetical protein